MIHAILPAAGLSRRMGRPKLLLPLAGRTILAIVIETLQRAGVDHLLVVVGPDHRELADQARAAGVQVLVLPAPTAEMRATVQAGLDWIEARHHPLPEDTWLLIPADHPTLDAAVVRRLIQARQDPAASIVVPTYLGQRGHPVLAAWRHVEAIRRFPAGEGINRYFRQQAADTIEVPVASDSVLLDLDTPEDYARLLN